MAEQAHASHEAHAHPNYIKIYWTLVALLCVSVIGPMFGIKAVTLVTAFGIAAYKAYLVAKNFMHINVEKPFISYLVLTVVVFMFLFFAGTAPDVMKHQGTRWEKPTWIAGTAHAAPPGAHGTEHEPAHH
jgi:caa(3)-type oxidase subunit IV